ncbi:unnamed protein product [Echinostoma caproni]|uniref:TMV resistance protein N-like n=1 Tax=Echinostoma caproni TaxID=27848 RepID=A0A183B0Y3_9TREM|nr:unnamed protein product [Echinostoma caproni]
MGLLRQSAHLAAVTGAETQLEIGMESPGNFVYIEENYENVPNETDQPPESVPPKSESRTPKRRSKGKKPSSEPVKTTPSETTTDVRENPEGKEKQNMVQSVDELLDAEIAREVDELVLVSSDEPLNDELDRELELELAELDKTN